MNKTYRNILINIDSHPYKSTRWSDTNNRDIRKLLEIGYLEGEYEYTANNSITGELRVTELGRSFLELVKL